MFSHHMILIDLWLTDSSFKSSQKFKLPNLGPCKIDLQVMVNLGFLFTREYLSWQKILSKSSALCQNCKPFCDFPLYLTEFSNIFCQTIKIELKFFSQIKLEVDSKELFFAENFY